MILIIIFILLIGINIFGIVEEGKYNEENKTESKIFNISLATFTYFYHFFSIISSLLAILYILKK